MDTERKAQLAVLASADATIAERRTETSRRVRTFYRLKRMGFARMLFEAEDPAELRRRVRYLWAVIRSDQSATREFADSLAERRALAARLEADVAALANVRAELQGRVTALQAERDRRAGLIRDVRTRPALATQVVQERSDAAAALSRTLAVSAAPTAPATDFRAEKGRLPAPVNGSVARGFGPYTDPASGAPANNLGLDYAAALGTPFRAVADGEVTRSGYIRGYGQVVIVQHGPYTTLYAHANGLRVATGQSVHRGEVLGLVGNTGLAEDTEARLHFEIRYNNTPQDPSEWLGR